MKTVKAMARWLSRLVFSDNDSCPICGRVLFDERRFLCSRCEEDLHRATGRVCKGCGRVLVDDVAVLCPECRREMSPVFDGGFTWLVYGQSASRLMYGFKFDGRRQLALWAGGEMGKAAAACEWLRAADALVPVPLHANRLASRGYNQSALLAEGVAASLRETGLSLPVWKHGLQRSVDTPHQLGAERAFRLQNVAGAFRVNPDQRIAGKRLVLVDDVMTTGATLRACASALKASGAAAVYVLTCAATT